MAATFCPRLHSLSLHSLCLHSLSLYSLSLPLSLLFLLSPSATVSLAQTSFFLRSYPCSDHQRCWLQITAQSLSPAYRGQLLGRPRLRIQRLSLSNPPSQFLRKTISRPPSRSDTTHAQDVTVPACNREGEL